MLDTVFYLILNMSVASCFVIATLLLIRQIKPLPRRVVYPLWGLAFFRLVMPFTLPTSWSLFNYTGGLVKRLITVETVTMGTLPVQELYNPYTVNSIPVQESYELYTMNFFGAAQQYATTLLRYAEDKRLLVSTAFGSSGVKVRIVNILNYKKLTIIGAVISALFLVVIAIALITNPQLGA